VIVSFMCLAGGIKDGIQKGLPPLFVLQAIPYLLPEALRFAIPGSLLFAVCVVFGRMAAANEVLAIQSAGVPLWRMIWPVLIVAYLLGISTFLLYETCAVWARPGIRRLLTRSFAEVVEGWIRTNGSFHRDWLSVSARGVEADQLLDPIICFRDPSHGRDVTVVAARVQMRFDEDRGLLAVSCRDATVEIDGLGTFSHPGEFRHEVALPGSDEPAPLGLSPAALSTSQVREQIPLEERKVAELASARTTPASSGQGGAELDFHQTRLYRLQAETPRRLANGLCCVGFALIGIPVATRMRSSDTFSIFFLCFGPILLGYYPLLVVGETIARNGFWPAGSVWLANLATFVVGGVLMWRCLRK
jgi:lipopolysaccharide export system permease protein